MAKSKKKTPEEKIVLLKAEVVERRSKSKDVRSDSELRRARKRLRRAQRKMAHKAILSVSDQIARSQKVLDMINARLDVLTKTAKKTSEDPFVHSLRKKSSSLNKRFKRLNKIQEKIKKAEEAKKPPEKDA